MTRPDPRLSINQATIKYASLARGSAGDRGGGRGVDRTVARARGRGRTRRGGPDGGRLGAPRVEPVPRRILHRSGRRRAPGGTRREPARDRGDRAPRRQRRAGLGGRPGPRGRRSAGRIPRPCGCARACRRRGGRTGAGGPRSRGHSRAGSAASDVRGRPRRALHPRPGTRHRGAVPGRVGRSRGGHVPRLVGPAAHRADRPRRAGQAGSRATRSATGSRLWPPTCCSRAG